MNYDAPRDSITLWLPLVKMYKSLGRLEIKRDSKKIGLLKYNGGGDWYANPTALSNLILYCNQELGTNIDPVYDEVSVSDQSIYNYPLVHLTHFFVFYLPKIYRDYFLRVFLTLFPSQVYMVS
mgnify:CR=1 FL=1